MIQRRTFQTRGNPTQMPEMRAIRLRIARTRMPRTGLALVAATLALAACSGMQPVAQDERGHFDTVEGMYGGNEFSPLSPEGERRFAGDKAAASGAAPAPARAAAPAPTSAPASAGVVPAGPPGAPAAVTLAAAAPAGDATAAPIAIDAHAFAAVFGADATLVRPSTEQLMQLDSLSIVAAESLRVDLQEKILACRRAGERCRLARR